MIRLRYRLIPYIYSTAWQVTSNNDSYMRPLFSDFAADKKVWNITDEFMFGHSILATPIVNAQYTEEKVIRTDAMTGWDRQTTADGSPAGAIDFTANKTATKYLPKGCAWYDFWTGKKYNGGQNITFETAFDRVPMFVRAGSILPLGPEMQYVGEKTWENLEVRLFPGADGTFTLYEDEGDSYRYEQGVYSTITFHWNDRKQTLTIGSRQGNYPGMLQSRKFNIVLPDGRQQTANYQGQEVQVAF
jgi:alpha-D-xyloside xylohydrolase